MFSKHQIYSTLPGIKLISLLLFCNLLFGCTSFMYAANDDPIHIDPHKRTFGQYLDDENLETVVEVNIKKASDNLNIHSRINVQVYNGIVLLTGQVPTHTDKNLASDTATGIYQVRQVHNELAISDAIGFNDKMQDNWIEGKIKSQLKKSDKLDEDYIKVVVENDVVYLMGMVTKDQAGEATEVTRTTKGVKKVVRVFEYIAPEVK